MYSLEEVPITLRDQEKTQASRPCHVYQEVMLKRPCKLRYITFQNYYCASIQVQVKQSAVCDWNVVVEDFELMDNCFFENDAQCWHTLDTSEWPPPFEAEENVHAIRFVLRQPCPTWRNFGLTELKCHQLVMQAADAPAATALTQPAEDVPAHISNLADSFGAMQASLRIYRQTKASITDS